jgi:hypothetical protein
MFFLAKDADFFRVFGYFSTLQVCTASVSTKWIELFLLDLVLLRVNFELPFFVRLYNELGSVKNIFAGI